MAQFSKSWFGDFPGQSMDARIHSNIGSITGRPVDASSVSTMSDRKALSKVALSKVGVLLFVSLFVI